jgi:hypothetical protein
MLLVVAFAIMIIVIFKVGQTFDLTSDHGALGDRGRAANHPDITFDDGGLSQIDVAADDTDIAVNRSLDIDIAAKDNQISGDPGRFLYRHVAAKDDQVTFECLAGLDDKVFAKHDLGPLCFLSQSRRRKNH